MKCPHCRTAIHENMKTILIDKDIEAHWFAVSQICPECKKLVVMLGAARGVQPSGMIPIDMRSTYLVRPKMTARNPLPPEVPKEFSEDYNEASLVLSDSPKASAALARRCLQNLLRMKGGIKNGDLANEIQQIIDGGNLPSYILNTLDAVRNIGNFAAHPIKSRSTGEIVDVEIGEAEWTLDVLETLFDFYFIQPKMIDQKKEALNKKLKEAGKPEMK